MTDTVLAWAVVLQGIATIILGLASIRSSRTTNEILDRLEAEVDE